MTVIEKVLLAVSKRFKTYPTTCAQISKSMECNQSSVSSALCKSVKQGKISRVDNFGPRKGYGYYMTDDQFADYRNSLTLALPKNNN